MAVEISIRQASHALRTRYPRNIWPTRIIFSQFDLNSNSNSNYVAVEISIGQASHALRTKYPRNIWPTRIVFSRSDLNSLNLTSYKIYPSIPPSIKLNEQNLSKSQDMAIYISDKLIVDICRKKSKIW